MPPAKSGRLKELLQRLLLLLALPLLIASQQPSFQVKGVSGSVLKNVIERLKELAKNNNLLQLTPSELKEQTVQAIEPFGYFRSRIEVHRTNQQWDISINPGLQMRITSLDIQLTGEGADNYELQKILHTLPLKKGDPLIISVYTESKEALLTAAEHQGYLHGSFTTAKIVINKENYTSQIQLVLNTGPQYYFGKLQFDPGTISPELLQRYAPFHYGEPYSTDKILVLNTQLSNSGYFNNVIIKPEINSQSHVPIKIHTIPVPRYSYSLGGGYGTDTGPRGRVSLNMVPVNSSGHKFDVILQGSAKQNALQAQYMIPGTNPVTDQYNLAASLGYLDYDSGRSGSLLLLASQRHTLQYFQRILSLNSLLERYRYTNQLKNSTYALYPKVTFTWNNASNPLFSPSGYNFSVNALGAAHNLGSDFSFGQVSLDLKAALFFEPVRTRLYFHGIQGITAIDNINQLPLSLSLLLGGNDNLKGYSINSIGPGRIITYGGLEIQKEIFNKWYLIGFADAGDVYNPTPKAFQYDAGAGLMWVSPIGPIKIGVAQPINDRFQRLGGSSPRLVINMGPDL